MIRPPSRPHPEERFRAERNRVSKDGQVARLACGPSLRRPPALARRRPPQDEDVLFGGLAMIRVQREDFDPGAELRALTAGRRDIGGVVSFVGLVRDMAGGAAIGAMTLEHYPGMTEKKLAEIEAEAHRRWPLSASLIVHRYGRLEPGDRIVLVITASPHREAAFEACHFLIDWLKTKAPFWKLEDTEHGADGSTPTPRTTRRRRGGRRSSFRSSRSVRKPLGETASMWTEYLRNKESTLGPFGGAPPAIEGVYLSQIVLHHPAAVHTCFEYEKLPDNVPAQWQAKQFDRLQLRLSFIGVSEVSLVGNLHSYLERCPVSVKLTSGIFDFEALNRTFRFSLQFEDAYGGLHPYSDAAALDHQAHLWFRGPTPR